MKQHPTFIILLILLSTTFLSAQEYTKRPSVAEPNPEGLEDYLQRLLNEAYIPGISLAIVREGKIVYNTALGLKSMDTGEALDQETIFAAASLSKPLFAYAVLKLVERGEFDLDKPLYEYMEYPDISSDDRYKQITARMVLSHSGGFPNWRNGDLKILFTPGERFQYSGEGFVYLMKVIEHISGKKINDWMQEMAFEPLGMNHSSYVWKDAYEANFAMPHNEMKKTFPKFKPQEGNTAHSLQTTAADFAQFINALIQYKGLKQETIEQMLSPQVKVSDEQSGTVDWGIGIGLQKVDNRKAFWHWGDNGTFRCFVIGFPLEQTGLVYFTNSSNGLGIAPTLVARVFGTQLPSMEWQNYDPYNSPTRKILIAALDGNFDPIIQQYLDRGGQHQDTLLINERSMNRLGYNLMAFKLMNEAKKVLRMNMKAYPKSSNVYDSYAEACLRNGDQAEAAQFYAKAAEMNPENKIAATIVERLNRQNHQGNATFRMEGYPMARHVSLAGSFNNWNDLSHPLIWENGAWTCTLQLEPGDYEYKFVVDGVWIPDPSNKNVNPEDNLNSMIKIK